MALSGTKSKTKLYRWHTGHPGGLKTLTARHMFERAPERVLQKAVLGMLPKNRLRKRWATKLRIYAGPDHEHEANTRGSKAYAPEFMEQYRPKSAHLRPKGDTGDFVVDFLEDGAAEEQELEEEDLHAEWAALVAEAEEAATKE